jgi:hypothetical protein
MMTRRIGFLTMLGLFALAPAVAEAQRYSRRGGYVNTPFGPVNMQTMQATGGDPFSALQMQQQMQMMQQQQQMMKYQQQMEKQAQQQKNQPSLTDQSQMYPTGSNVTSVSKKKKKTSSTTAKADPKKAEAKKDESKKDESKKADPSKASKSESTKVTTSPRAGSKP